MLRVYSQVTGHFFLFCFGVMQLESWVGHPVLLTFITTHIWEWNTPLKSFLVFKRSSPRDCSAVMACSLLTWPWAIHWNLTGGGHQSSVGVKMAAVGEVSTNNFFILKQWWVVGIFCCRFCRGVINPQKICTILCRLFHADSILQTRCRLPAADPTP